MRYLRLACYNIAWFARLFDRNNRLIGDREPSAMPGVSRRRQGEAVADVLRHVDADCFAIIEAPNSGHRQSCVAELEGFAARFDLRQRKALIGFENPTHQEIALLFDPARIGARHEPIGEVLDAATARLGSLPFGAPRFDSVFPADLDGDGKVELHHFSKPPLEAVVADRTTGFAFRLIAVHLKSKEPNFPGAPGRFHRQDESRAKQFAQAVWLRRRIEEHLGAGEEIIVLGDFNDGPGDDSVGRLEGRSSVELILGTRDRPETLMANPYVLHTPPYGREPASARFASDDAGESFDVLIDYVMVSPVLAAQSNPVWRIWHPDDDAACRADSGLRRALLDASDHFPVSVDLFVGD